MNNLLLPIKIALSTFSKNKGRTFLTGLGIVIGITAVIVVLSTGQAIKGLVVGELEAFGTDFIEIEVKTPQTSQASVDNAISMVGGSVITTLKEEDAEAVARHPNISNFYAGVMGQKLANYESEIKKVLIFGTSAAFIDIDTAEVDAGRFFTEQDNKSLAKVVVLGYETKNKLFGEQDPIGESIKVDKDKFRVIGTLKEKGASFGMDMDNMIFMPLQTLQKRILGIDYVSFIFAQMIDPDLGDQTVEDVNLIMRDQHKITDPNKDDFAVISMDQMMEMMDTVIYGIQILLIALGSISLIVGGVGIMNIMYVSVTERTFEIGLRKANGAKYKDILLQFLAESVILTLVGGIVGIIAGIAISWLVSIVATSLGFNWTFAISWSGLIIAVIMSIIVGVIFGLYPARQAAKKNPIEALRHE
ncbi:ABC transporter permease [Candidatus Kuenenbacteria bacterium]|nr:ABC transporter permease [Candidatus Kuenenbacteria bacterium]